ncbi:MAG: DUF4013 domain-containing protein [Candidatus Methanofastidiosum sp.]|nr:DUF4013 domain-containing protein [Methanofastidiosum sp.]
MVNYTISFKKPFSDFRKLFIGIIASFVPIVNWISFGYILECSDIKKDVQTGMMAEWGDLKDMLVKGFKGYLIEFIYSIPIIVSYFFVFFKVIAPSVIRGMESVKFDSLPVPTSNPINPKDAIEIMDFMIKQMMPLLTNSLIEALPFLIIIFVLIAYIWYLIPIAVLNYYRHDKFEEAFNFTLIKKYAITKKYLGAWMIFFVLNLGYHAISFLPMGLFFYNPFLAMRLSNGLSLLPAIVYFIISMISFSFFADVIKEIDGA